MRKLIALVSWILALFPFTVLAHFDKVEWIDVSNNSYITPTEIEVEKNYRLHMHNHQLLYFKFKKSLLESNQTYNIFAAYPGSHSCAFHLFWVDFAEDFPEGYFNAQNPKFRPADAYKTMFLTDNNGYVTNEKAQIFLDESNVAYYHFVIFNWQFMYSRDPEVVQQGLDFVIGIKKTHSYASYKYEVGLYVTASILVFIWFILFLKKKIGFITELTRITYCTDDIPKKE